MSRESGPSPADAGQAPQPQSLFNEDGSVNEELLSQKYGLGMQEASQEVSFGSYKGTVAEMLNDPKCPVGGIIGGAYEQDGLTGVEKQLTLLSMMAPTFKVEIGESTREREDLKKNSTQNQRPISPLY